MHKLLALIQARSASTRLPGKVLYRIPEKDGKTILEHIIYRLRTVLPEDSIIVLIPENDTQLVNFCKNHNIRYMEGHPTDVRHRYIAAAEKFEAEGIIRLTADNPFIDIEHIELLIEAWFYSKPDLVSFSGLPLGTGVELFSRKALESVPTAGLQPHHREHVSLHIKEEPEQFRIFRLKPLLGENEVAAANLRLTVDEKKDYDTLNAVYPLFAGNEYFCVKDILQAFHNNRDIFSANQNVEQIRFNLPSQDTTTKKSVLLHHAPVKIHGTGHYERCKYLFVYLQLNGFDCSISDEFPLKEFDYYIIDHRDIPLPDEIAKEKVLLLDNQGPDRNNCRHLDFLYNPAVAISSGIFPAILSLSQTETGKGILVYAGSQGKKESIMLDEMALSLSPNVTRIGGAEPETDVIYYNRVSRMMYYSLLASSDILIAYPGQSIGEGIFLGKKVILYSISEIHKSIAKHIAATTGIYYAGDIGSTLQAPQPQSIVAAKTVLKNNGLEQILEILKC